MGSNINILLIVIILTIIVIIILLHTIEIIVIIIIIIVIVIKPLLRREIIVRSSNLSARSSLLYHDHYDHLNHNNNHIDCHHNHTVAEKRKDCPKLQFGTFLSARSTPRRLLATTELMYAFKSSPR